MSRAIRRPRWTISRRSRAWPGSVSSWRWGSWSPRRPAAVWFYKLYRSVRPVAGVAVAAFGLVNAVAIMASATFMATAAAVAGDRPLVAGGDPAAAVGLLHQLSTHAWGIGALFFGLWLIPMGWATVTTRRFPVALGWVLIVGGVGYLLSALADYGLASPPGALVEGLAFPATIGEFWMIGYLLIRGIRPERPRQLPQAHARSRPRPRPRPRPPSAVRQAGLTRSRLPRRPHPAGRCPASRCSSGSALTGPRVDGGRSAGPGGRTTWCGSFW